MSELISVLIPSFNQGAFIGETLDSIRRQEYSRVECIVMDGGSTDQTAKVVRSFGPMVTLFRSEPDRGQSDALNKALLLARGTILAWQNSDDFFVGSQTFKQAAEMLARGEADILYGDTLVVDERSRPLYIRYGLPATRRVFVNQRMFVANQSAFMRREVVERVGLVDERLHYAMDVDFYLRCLLSGVRFRYVPRFWGGFRTHGGTKYGSAQRPRFQVEVEEVFRRLGVRRSAAGYGLGLLDLLTHALRHGHLPYYLHRYVLRDLPRFLPTVEQLWNGRVGERRTATSAIPGPAEG